MPTRRFKRIVLAPLLLSGCAVMFGACVLIEPAQAQPGYVPPPTPLPPPVLNEAQRIAANIAKLPELLKSK